MNIRIILFLITTSLLVISKLASNYTNVSPFIALVIVSAYFIENKQHLLIMVFISQLISDFYFGFHSSNFFVYLSYFIMISIIYIHQVELSIVASLIKSIHSNIIFFFISNIGHFLTFNNTYSLTELTRLFIQGIPFGLNLFYSTIFFVLVIHAILAVSKIQPAFVRSARKIN